MNNVIDEVGAKVITKKQAIIYGSLLLIIPMQVHAHEQFIAEVSFEDWERHCHAYELKGTQECWAILQRQLNDSEESKRGFVIIVQENESFQSFELWDIDQFGYSVNIQIDDSRVFKLACHASRCTPWKREETSELISQMKTGKKLSLQGYSRNSEEVNSTEIVSLNKFSAVLGN